MGRIFNINGACQPTKHYMVDLELRLKTIKLMIDAGEYFTINRTRQYGKTMERQLYCGLLQSF